MNIVKRNLEFHADALPGHVHPDDEAEGVPINYLQLAIHYKWRLLVAGIAGLILGHLAYVRSGPEYAAFSQVKVWKKNPPPVREDDRMLTGQAKPSDHIPDILSPVFIAKAIQLGELDKLPTFAGETDFVEAVQDGLKVKRVAGNDRSVQTVFEIRYSSPQAADARKVVEAIIAQYAVHLKEVSLEESTEMQGKASKSVEDMLDKLHAAEAAYREFILTVPEEYRAVLGPKTSATQTSNIAPEDVIHTLGEERNRNRVRLADLTSRQKAIRNAQAAGDSQEALELQVRRFLNADGRSGEDADRQLQISIYQSQLLPLINKERELSEQVGRDNFELVSVRRSIEKILQTYAKLGLKFPEGVEASRFAAARGVQTDFVALYLDSLRHQVDEHQLKDRELASMIQVEGVRAKEFSGYLATDQNLHAEIVLLQDSWKQQLDVQNSVATEKDTNGFRMKVLAPVKHELAIKKLMKFYVGGTSVLVMLMAVLCLVQELRDLRLKSVRDIRVCLRQPVLGSVAAFDVPHDSGRGPHPALRYLHAPNSIEAENYRSIRTALLVTADNHDARCVLVSSPEPGDGKSTLVSNLAIAMAQSGKRVLLIDADLRRPTIHNLFRVSREIGVTEVLSGEIDFLNAVRPTTVERLSLLVAGSSPTNPAELLSSPRLMQMLRDAKDEFDFVFVDAPPLLAVSDPCILARHVDGMLVVARIGKNTRTSAARVRELIQNQGITVLGTVANGVIPGQDRGYSYSHYGEYVSNDSVQSPAAREPAGV